MSEAQQPDVIEEAVTWAVPTKDAYGPLSYKLGDNVVVLIETLYVPPTLSVVLSDIGSRVIVNVPLYVVGELINAHHARQARSRQEARQSEIDGQGA